MSDTVNTTEVKPLTLQGLSSECAALVSETRGSLYALGNRLFAYGKTKGMEKASEIVDSIITEGTLQGLKFDRSFITRAMTASRNGKLAGKYNCFNEWKAAPTDKDAQMILDAAQGIKRNPPTQKSDLQKAISAIDRLTDDGEIRAILAHIKRKVLAADSTPKQDVA